MGLFSKAHQRDRGRRSRRPGTSMTAYRKKENRRIERETQKLAKVRRSGHGTVAAEGDAAGATAPGTAGAPPRPSTEPATTRPRAQPGALPGPRRGAGTPRTSDRPHRRRDRLRRRLPRLAADLAGDEVRALRRRRPQPGQQREAVRHVQALRRERQEAAARQPHARAAPTVNQRPAAGVRQVEGRAEYGRVPLCRARPVRPLAIGPDATRPAAPGTKAAGPCHFLAAVAGRHQVASGGRDVAPGSGSGRREESPPRPRLYSASGSRSPSARPSRRTGNIARCRNRTW